MSKRTINLEWAKLLGFDQAKAGTDVLKQAPKIGSKQCIPVPGTIGRPQQLGLIRAGTAR